MPLRRLARVPGLGSRAPIHAPLPPPVPPAAGRRCSRSPIAARLAAPGGRAAPRAAAGPWQEAAGTAPGPGRAGGHPLPSSRPPACLPGAADVACCRRPAPGEARRGGGGHRLRAGFTADRRLPPRRGAAPRPAAVLRHENLKKHFVPAPAARGPRCRVGGYRVSRGEAPRGCPRAGGTCQPPGRLNSSCGRSGAGSARRRAPGTAGRAGAAGLCGSGDTQPPCVASRLSRPRRRAVCPPFAGRGRAAPWEVGATGEQRRRVPVSGAEGNSRGGGGAAVPSAAGEGPAQLGVCPSRVPGVCLSAGNWNGVSSGLLKRRWKGELGYCQLSVNGVGSNCVGLSLADVSVLSMTSRCDLL